MQELHIGLCNNLRILARHIYLYIVLENRFHSSCIDYLKNMYFLECIYCPCRCILLSKELNHKSELGHKLLKHNLYLEDKYLDRNNQELVDIALFYMKIQAYNQLRCRSQHRDPLNKFPNPSNLKISGSSKKHIFHQHILNRQYRKYLYTGQYKIH